MANKPPKGRVTADEKGLTEWQKRNLDFMKQKEIEKKEQEKLQKELVALKRKTLHTNDEDRGASDRSSKTSKQAKGNRARQRRPRPASQRPVSGKKVVRKQPVANKGSFARSIKFRRRMTSVLVPAVIGIMLSIFFMTPFSKLKHFEVQGTNKTSSSAVIKASGVKDDAYTLSTFFDRDQLASNIKANNPWVKSVSIGYKFPITFTVKVKEYKIVAYAQTDQGYVPILESGQRLDSVTASGLPDRFTTINLKNGNDLNRLIKSLIKMDQSLVRRIKVISLADSKTTKDLLKLEMQDGNTVYVPLSQIEKKLPYYPKIKKKLRDNTVVDMEVGIYATNPDGGAATDGDSDQDQTSQEDTEAQGQQTPETVASANQGAVSQDPQTSQSVETPESSSQTEEELSQTQE